MRTWDGTCVFFCVPPSFVLTDNKGTPTCAVFPVGAKSLLNKSKDELRMTQWCLYFHSSFSFYSRPDITVMFDWA